MAMGRRKDRARTPGLWIAANDLPLFNEKGELLKPHEWPDEIAHSIESVDVAGGKVKLVSKMAANRTILEVTGKVRGESTVDQLVEAMKATIEQNQEKGKKKP